MKAVYTLITDGSVYPNPGIYGGWAYLIRKPDDKYIEAKGYSEIGVKTTNNEMEIYPIIKGLEHIAKIAVPNVTRVLVRSDSAFIIKSIRNGWFCKNPNVMGMLIKFYELEKQFKQVWFDKVKGHSGDTENEWANDLAEAGRLSNPTLPQNMKENPYATVQC